MKKETFLAIALTCVVWGAWFMFFSPEQKQPAVDDQMPIGPAISEPVANKPSLTIPSPRVNQNLTEEFIPFETERFKGQFNSRGAVISEMILKGITEGEAMATVPDSTFHAKGIFDFPVHFTANEFIYGSDLDKTVWSVIKKDENEVVFSTRAMINNDPLEIRKHYKLNETGDTFHLEYSFINHGRQAIQFPERAVIFSPADMVGPKLDYSNSFNLLKGITSLNGDYTSLGKDEDDVVKRKDGSSEWVGLSGRFLLLIMMPTEQSGSGVISDDRKNTGHRAGMLMPVDAISAGSSITKSFTVYLGPKEKSRLEAIDPKLKSAADVSLLVEPIRQFVIWSLLKLNGLFGNIGWSLVVFSLLTKLVFLPLTKKSTDSMKKMQLLTPQINALKTKYKDKPDVMQREMMALYKTNKVNPLSGCLPLLVQMPFFFALYSALTNSIDLWNAPFILWMQDMSMPDTVAQIAGVKINILPLVMTITTYFQQKLSTVDTGQSKQQKILMGAMPLLFIFIFWSMPSGLVLYWILQNIFQITHQLFVNRMGKVK